MRRRSPGVRIEDALDRAMKTRLPPYDSTVAPLHRETTVCYAYMCQYAYACAEKSRRPAQVLKRRCMRYQPESMRAEPSVSDYALDMLARRRVKGRRLAPQTVALLERVRPDGPIRKRGVGEF